MTHLLLLLLAVAPLSALGAPLPEPLPLDVALSQAEKHPRILAEAAWRLPRRRAFYLDCHTAAFSSLESSDPGRDLPFEQLLDPVDAQRIAIIMRFFDVLLADLAHARFSEAMAVAYIQYDRSRARRELGQHSELDVAELEAAYEALHHRRESATALQRLTRSLLAQALDRPGELPRDLITPSVHAPGERPTIEQVNEAAANANPVLAAMPDADAPSHRRLLAIEIENQGQLLLARLEALDRARDAAEANAFWRELVLDESRTLYEFEAKADLGFAMSQQTRARFDERRIDYCSALAWAELNALMGRAVWPPTEAP